jgi:dihydroorotase
MVLDEVREAVRRGVVFDAGHGRGSFSFDVAEKALAQGVEPETVSSDLHYYNVFGPVYNLSTTVSKFIHLRLTLEATLAKVTFNPAKLLRIDKQIGSLRRGSIADIAVFDLKEGSFKFEDAIGKVVVGRRLLDPVAVVRSGRVYASRLRLSGRK